MLETVFVSIYADKMFNSRSLGQAEASHSVFPLLRTLSQRTRECIKERQWTHEHRAVKIATFVDLNRHISSADRDTVGETLFRCIFRERVLSTTSLVPQAMPVYGRGLCKTSLLRRCENCAHAPKSLVHALTDIGFHIAQTAAGVSAWQQVQHNPLAAFPITSACLGTPRWFVVCPQCDLRNTDYEMELRGIQVAQNTAPIVWAGEPPEHEPYTTTATSYQQRFYPFKQSRTERNYHEQAPSASGIENVVPGVLPRQSSPHPGFVSESNIGSQVGLQQQSFTDPSILRPTHVISLAPSSGFADKAFQTKRMAAQLSPRHDSQKVAKRTRARQHTPTLRCVRCFARRQPVSLLSYEEVHCLTRPVHHLEGCA